MMRNIPATASSRLVIVGLVWALAACETPSEPSAGTLHVTAVSDAAVATPSQPALVQVTATNTGSGAVSWGPGSSICRLALMVRNEGAWHVVPRGPCTADVVTYVLQPGESRTETIAFDGQYNTAAGTVTLRAGSFELRGAALPVDFSDPLVVEFRPDA